MAHEFAVGEMPGGRSDEALDIGTLEMKLLKRLQVGEQAPAFTVQTLDGKPLKLSDYRGKYVLLDFWAVWCGPCREQLPHLKAVFDVAAGNPKFAMIGLSLDAKEEAPRKFVAGNAVSWPQGFLGEQSKSRVASDYGIQGIPAVFLIGPDGRIVAKDLRGEAVRTAVAQALAIPAPSTRPAATR